jgi:hypothetical protein
MFALLSDLHRKAFIPVGILLPAAPPEDRGKDHLQSSLAVALPQVLRWLDNQPPKSVIDVALGSEAPLTLENIHELVIGLELAGVRFLWALCKSAGTSNDDELLPSGFKERTQARGAVCMGWVPQMKAQRANSEETIGAEAASSHEPRRLQDQADVCFYPFMVYARGSCIFPPPPS